MTLSELIFVFAVIMLENDPMGFVLEFHFGPNEYFTNSVLTKEYNMKCQPDPEHPFDFEGPEIYKCIVSHFFLFKIVKYTKLFQKRVYFTGLPYYVV